MARTRYGDLCETFHVSRIATFLGKRLFQHPARSRSDIAVRDEAKEVRPDASPQAGGCPSFHGSWERTENDTDGRGSFAAVDKVKAGQALR